MSKHDEDLLQARNEQLARSLKEATPSAYVDRAGSTEPRETNRWWVFLLTPSGVIVRLFSSYPNKADAEGAVGIYGFRLIARPPTATLNRNNTTAR